MKEYLKPELKIIDFAAEAIADIGTGSGEDDGNLDNEFDI